MDAVALPPKRASPARGDDGAPAAGVVAAARAAVDAALVAVTAEVHEVGPEGQALKAVQTAVQIRCAVK